MIVICVVLVIDRFVVFDDIRCFVLISVFLVFYVEVVLLLRCSVDVVFGVVEVVCVFYVVEWMVEGLL